ncbi:MAG: hypothetical protein A2X58_06460 [Nitrospirae bacterium GWC2_56_14]|nr:MAG: hypothetical protein A2X58_06460 [Nitrospirae bacterium GWC2_56_14]
MQLTLKKKMDVPNVKVNKRLLGKILIDGDFVDQHAIESALARQKDTNEKLGEILRSMGQLNSVDLKAVLSVQKELASFEESIKAAAGDRKLLGELLLKAKRITPEQLSAALEEQRKSGGKLGSILIRRGLLNENELKAVLSFQQHQGSEAPASTVFRLGEILVATEQITREQLEAVLANQKLSKKKIGELLIEAGHVQPHQIDYSLKLQRKLVTAALIAALSMAALAGGREAFAGSSTGPSTSAKISMTATVLEHTRMQILHQAQEFVITQADIMRGFVEVPAASRVAVKSNNPAGYLLAFEVMSGPDAVFNSVNVLVGGRDVQIPAGGGWIPQPYIRGGITMDVSYRFSLAKGAQPGTYSWPLMVSVQSM